MTPRRPGFLAPLLIAGALGAGCGGGATNDTASVVIATVNASTGVPFVSQLRATMSNQNTLKVNLYPTAPASAPITFPATFAVTLPEARSGNLDIALDGLDAAGGVVANGAARAMIVVGDRADVAITLAVGASLCGNATPDPGESCDDGNRKTGDGCDFRCQVEPPPWTGPLPTITEFLVPALAAPQSITTGSDGNLWFTETVAGKVGRITPAGDINDLAIPSGTTSAPTDIALGPDGNVWLLATSGTALWRVTPAGEITKVTPTSALGTPNVIILGPDNNLWLGATGRIGRLATDGTLTYFTLPYVNATIGGMARGPDGNIWFTESNANNIGRITPAGQVTEFPIPTASAGANGIAGGPDGNIWFTEYSVSKIGRATMDGKITEFTPPSTPSYPLAIVGGPDGNVWFTEYENKIGRITPAGGINEFPIPPTDVTDVQITDITVGPDGNIWFTESKHWTIGRLEL